MGSMRGRLRRIEQQADREMLSFELEDGSIARFPHSAFLECLVHEWERGRELRSSGSTTKDAHPLLKALKKAENRERAVAEYGIILMTDAENSRAEVGSHDA
jgi:hypothetical protein